MRLVRFPLVVLTLALAGCFGGGVVPPPVVDMEGVDVAQHNRDLADCYDNRPFFSIGSYITRCMEAKGYTILVRR